MARTTLKVQKKTKKSGSAKRAPRAAGAAPPSRWAAFKRAVFRLTTVSLGAATLGCTLVFAVLYREARDTVEARLENPLWETTGEVLSGPFRVWPGLASTPEELGGDLERAGYVRAQKPSRPGDFSVSGDAVLVRTRAEKGEGWATREQEVLITFKSEAVASISPDSAASFPPVRLAAVRGPENVARSPKPLSHFPKQLQDAVLAMEDDTFWEHSGVSVFGIARAFLTNAVEGERVQGGSTLTQQLAKNLFLSPERTYARKAREALLAFALEDRLSKEEILALYLNEIYWGQAGGAAVCGADEAARAYFSKPADRLSLEEAAVLGGMISAPNTYNPLRHPEKARERRDLALSRMEEEGWLAPEEAKRARERPMELRPSPSGRVAPYVVDAALEQVDALMGEGAVLREGLTVQTWIHPPLQRLAERALADGIAQVEAAHPKAKGAEAALVAVRVSDGAVLAMVGGRDYGESQFNRAVQARRAVGSTVKPLTMLAAFEGDEALSPSTPLEDEPLKRKVSGELWEPKNYDGKYLGELTLRTAIAKSRNIPAVHLAEKVGLTRLKAFLSRLGLGGATANLSASLGAFEATPLELAGAYTAFPGQGWASQPMLLGALYDEKGGLIQRWEKRRDRAASARAAYMATDVLMDVLKKGTGAGASKYGVKGGAGGKTGTTDGYRDAWFVGFTRELVVVVWVGFDRTRATGLTGADGALPIWARFVAGSGTAAGSFERPEDVELSEACLAWEDGECSDCGEDLFTKGEAPEDACEDRILARKEDEPEAGGDKPRDVWEEIEDTLKREKKEKKKKRTTEDAPDPGARNGSGR